jgi:molybdopterin converting factor small subunit
MATVQVDMDGELLQRLRERYPGQSDREVLERLARIHLGMAALNEAQRRNAVPEDEALEMAVRAVHEARDSVA